MTEHRIRISVSTSKGPFPAETHPSVDGPPIQLSEWGTVCPGCCKVPEAGQDITKIFYSWWHATCGAAYLRSTAADLAWIALGHQLERSPSKFTNPETKAITHNLLRITGQFVTVSDPGGLLPRRAKGEALVPSGEAQFAEVIDGFHGSDLHAAVLQVQQRYPGELPAVTGMRAWSQLDEEQRRRHLTDLLQAYVELLHFERAPEIGGAS